MSTLFVVGIEDVENKATKCSVLCAVVCNAFYHWFSRWGLRPTRGPPGSVGGPQEKKNENNVGIAVIVDTGYCVMFSLNKTEGQWVVVGNLKKRVAQKRDA